MKRLAASFIEKSMALAVYLERVMWTPNPFKPVDPSGLAWTHSSPDAFYAVPYTPPQINFSRKVLGIGTLYDRFTFQSSYTSPYPKNNRVHGLANLRSEGKARAALVLIHGHAMRTFALLEWYARPAIEMGFDVYYMALPYHMRRAPAGTWSGQLSLNSDVGGSALAFMQGVKDLRSLMTWIEEVRKAPVVLAGVSLGAFTTLMTAVVDPRPKAILSILGGGSLAQIISDGYQLGRSRRQLKAGGVSAEQLEAYWRLVGPGNWQPRVDPDRILMLAGSYDPIVTPSNTEQLWRAWDKPALHWYPAGHASIAVYHHRVRQEIFDFLINCI